jgi:hypothetical protein
LWKIKKVTRSQDDQLGNMTRIWGCSLDSSDERGFRLCD